MKRLGLALAVFLSLVGGALAQGGMGPGPGTVHSTGGGGFSGPGDVVSGALAWYSCSRGYNTADTANACNVCLPADSVCADITLSAGFAVVPGSLSTCNITTVICTVKTAYDKSGNSRNATNATIANRPTFRPAMASNGCPTTSLPCMLFTAASSQLLTAATPTVTQAQPITMSIVYIRGANTGDVSFLGGTLGFLIPTGQIQMFAGSSAFVTAANGSWHAAQLVFNTTSSAGYVDGSATTSLSVGSGSPSGLTIGIGNAAVSANLDGSLAELGYWPSGFNATQAGNMNTNQHGANGYNF